MNTSARMYVHTYIHACICTCTCVFTCTCIYIYIHVCLFVSMFICTKGLEVIWEFVFYFGMFFFFFRLGGLLFPLGFR